MEIEQLETYVDKAVGLVIERGPNILLAILVLLIGLRLIKFFTKVLQKGFEKRNIDPTLRPFLSNLINWSLKALLFVSVAGMIGIGNTSFVAVIGAAGLAIGFALQGSLANFAGGVLIMLFKPYKVGDLIEAEGHLGVVEEIQIFVTKILSPQNRLIIIPNGTMSNGNIKNLTAKDHVRVDLTIGIAYDENIKDARKILMSVMTAHPKALAEPAPFVGVTELADSSINLAVRPWCRPSDYWDVYFEVLEECKEQLDKAGITIPFPQRDVHLFQHSADTK
ncbi:mechanosensitive ion channel family protein [Roseivirga pacifica]|uniref:mechanosensitive ion channel family protein n=1 Tax=Roseivirga pacifica TaxID=1267423 RepID=UPI002095EFF7|nr:mechanosensitive ion channel family protein [Roseivirga pacifica]MCO6360037.1 mechanosensitive ion channel [Roseivirga pacifica]MCO6367407.1 mechanosensitive ion channel [Roseivirga pacifica]MCO6370062.1 mechanosensitive ion channel [Roseivirga pacifica]MCO6375064.1 mechanosensitive ion channel [Roseivirga pacifica]MCO6380322.1 mechanosensitive ion channel [Roseivirga pacifica]